MAVRDLIYEYTDNKSDISQGLAYYQLGRVKKIKINSVDVDPHSTLPYSSTVIADAEVAGHHPFLVMRGNSLLSYNCTCPAGSDAQTLCPHLVALVRALSDILVPQTGRSDDLAVKRLLSFYSRQAAVDQDDDDDRARLRPTLLFDPQSGYFSLSFHIGNEKRMYVIKSISKFYDHLRHGDTVTYGRSLCFVHREENFTRDSRFYLGLIQNAFEWMHLGADRSGASIHVGRYLHLTNSQFDQLFDHVAANEGAILVETADADAHPLRMMQGAPQATIQVMSRSDDEFLLGVSMNDYRIYHSGSCSYFYNHDLMLRPDDGWQADVLPLLTALRASDAPLVLSQSQLQAFSRSVVPRISGHVSLDMDETTSRLAAPPSLSIYLQLDYPQANTVRGRLQFDYAGRRFNPLADRDVIPAGLRDSEREQAFLDLMTKYRFSVNEDEFLLVGEEAVYDFLHEGLPELMPLATIDIEDSLATIRPRAAKMPRMKVSVTRGIIELKFDPTLYDKDELIAVLRAYHAGKKFVRLTQGVYVDLINPDVHALDTLLRECGISPSKLAATDTFELDASRAITIDALDDATGGQFFDRRAAFNDLVRAIQTKALEKDVPLPRGLHATLRTYQVTGYQWLVRLAQLGFGGILADDMGLGKTVQVIAYLLHQAELDPQARAIVVMPTSLIYNWQAELARFAPDLPAVVCAGSAAERARLLQNLPDGGVLLTSYAALRRDIDHYQDMVFDSIISDEGQYIKNSYTQNTRSLKKLKGRHHFSLTGTPIENSLADLWSIMDFCMPGYLHSWKEFRALYEVPISRYEDTGRLATLRRQITPFVLRREKNDVLTELPEKIDTVLYAHLSEEEKRIYHAQLALSHKAFLEEIGANPTGASRIRVLALLMRLRQACCSPALFLDDWKRPSAKLSLCLSVIEDRVRAHSQMLVFSQFTSVLDLIAPELDKRGIPYLTLTGKTKAKDRMDLVNRFNNDHIPVFLISLKAGGVGLNLTAADTVIHFDPWWNQSVENQATDRTHRIGQKKSVTVIRLIAKDTIEEKILELKARKQQLSDAVITSDEAVINQMTMEDLHTLFALDYAATPARPSPRPAHDPLTLDESQYK
jgi:hypothetical protein